MGRVCLVFGLIVACASANANIGALLNALVGDFTTAQGQSFDSFDSPAAWTVIGDGEVAASTARVRQGSKSLRIVSMPDEHGYAVRTINANFTNSNRFSIWLYVESPSEYDKSMVLTLRFTSDDFETWMEASSDNLRQGWNKVLFTKSEFTARGSTNWNRTMTGVQIRLTNVDGGVISGYVDDMRVDEFSRPKVIISFDDGWDSTYQYGYKYLKNYGMKGTAFLVSSFVGEEDRITLAQGHEMYNYGWDMSNHTTTHSDLSAMTRAQIDNEFRQCGDFLKQQGWTRRNCHLHTAYPFGRYSDDTLAADLAAGFLTGRTTYEQIQANALDEPFLMYDEVPEGGIENLAAMKAKVDKVLATGGVLQLTFHRIVTGTPTISSEYRDVDFYALVDYVAAKRSQGLLDVITLSEWYDGMAPKPTNFLVTPSTVLGGTTTTAQVTLSEPAPSGGLPMFVAESSSVISAPLTVRVPAGATSYAFPIQTSAIASTTSFPITITSGGVSRTASLTVSAGVTAVSLTSVTLSPARVTSGGASTGTVTLSGPAPAGGRLVNLTYSSGLVGGVSSVVVPQGGTTKTFALSTGTVSTTTTVTVTASSSGATRTASLVIDPLPSGPNISALSLTTSSVTGGKSTTAWIQLSSAAPSGGAVVTIKATGSEITVPAQVTVAAGSNFAGFTILTKKVTTNVTRSITVTRGTSSKSASLTIKR